MAQFVLVAVTLIGLYRQIRQQNAANALERMVSLQGEWNSPRLTHARLAVAIWRKNTENPSNPDVEAQVPIAWLCNFFENLSDLYLDGNLSWTEIENTWGTSLVLWWAALRDAILETRTGTASAYGGFELLAERALVVSTKRGDDWAVSPEDLARVLEIQIGRNTKRLKMLRDIENWVIPVDDSAKA